MSKTEQCKNLINEIVSECDNEEWLAFTLSFLAGLYDKPQLKAIFEGIVKKYAMRYCA